MFNENLKAARKSKGFTQEELAIRLSIVRQTISKWEKGLSVPDSDMLIKLSDILEVSVSQLLGSTIESETETNEVADQLSRINEQMAIKNRRTKIVLKTIFGIIIGIVLLALLLILLPFFRLLITGIIK